MEIMSVSICRTYIYLTYTHTHHITSISAPPTQDLRAIFDELDTGGTGTLTFMQLGESLRRVNLFRSGLGVGDYHAELRAREEAILHERLWRALDPEGMNGWM